MPIAYLGIDVGSVSTNLVLIDDQREIISTVYLRTQGQPIAAVKKGIEELLVKTGSDFEIKGAGTTGSARYLSGVIVGADVVKNEITAHAVAASEIVKDVRTVLEIGGQDSKIIIMRDGVVVDFAMNTVCAAGTGSFLDHQSSRLGVPIEDFGSLALKSQSAAQIAGRCSVFAESDMIHKQQMGYRLEDIVFGLCEALVRNYLNNLAKGKDLEGPVVFQGGVAANEGMRRAFSEALGCEIVVPEHYDVMGAIGAALLAKEETDFSRQTKFKGFEVAEFDYETSSFMCDGCANTCEVVKIETQAQLLARWGGRCGKWEISESADEVATNA